ncbi:MAG: hypothetical protein R8M46_07825 [Ghiorsea sp.]
MPLKYLHIHGPLVVTLWLGLFLDSSFLAEYFPQNQLLTNGLVLMVFVWMFTHVSKTVKQLMLFGVGIAYLGEVTLSIGLGMYTYRLGNVPLYVPFGHALVYAGVYYIIKEPLIRQQQDKIIAALYALMFIYASAWLALASDVFGFVCMLLVILLFRRHPETRLFFLIMFFMVVYLELLGTYYQCWAWPSALFGTFAWLPSANPPSGIGVVYFAFDAACLLLYKLRNPKKWVRFRQLQKVATNKGL